jgi:hypothetical protein
MRVLILVFVDKAMFMWTRVIHEAKIICPLISTEFSPHSLLHVVILILHFYFLI